MDPFRKLFIRLIPKKTSKKTSPRKTSPMKTSPRKGYLIKGKIPKKIGSKAEVMHGSAIQTSDGFKKEDLTYNKNGSIVSKKKSIHGHKTYKEKKPR